jgi:hypothetical protein
MKYRLYGLRICGLIFVIQYSEFAIFGANILPAWDLRICSEL